MMTEKTLHGYFEKQFAAEKKLDEKGIQVVGLPPSELGEIIMLLMTVQLARQARIEYYNEVLGVKSA